jgi:ribosomal protein S14
MSLESRVKVLEKETVSESEECEVCNRPLFFTLTLNPNDSTREPAIFKDGRCVKCGREIGLVEFTINPNGGMLEPQSFCER